MEGKLHGLLKKTAVRELGIEGYRVYVEPPESPIERLNWSLYRPDVLGVISSESESIFAFVECETSPSASRLRNKTSKINRGLTFSETVERKACFPFYVNNTCWAFGQSDLPKHTQTMGDLDREPDRRGLPQDSEEYLTKLSGVWDTKLFLR